eukprot:scaffold4490_cov48-Phaeocystis_antarctica.AAC.1
MSGRKPRTDLRSLRPQDTPQLPFLLRPCSTTEGLRVELLHESLHVGKLLLVQRLGGGAAPLLGTARHDVGEALGTLSLALAEDAVDVTPLAPAALAPHEGARPVRVCPQPLDARRDDAAAQLERTAAPLPRDERGGRIADERGLELHAAVVSHQHRRLGHLPGVCAGGEARAGRRWRAGGQAAAAAVAAVAAAAAGVKVER